ncbi:MAG: glutaredoxin family protein [Micropruina sp.]|nr:glutaredoxin family protein [Micropruina sp.]
MPGPRVLVVVRDGCHLCDDAVAIAARVCTEVGAEWATANVDTDPGLAEHTDHVPVTFVDARRFAIWFLDERQLRAALTG